MGTERKTLRVLLVEDHAVFRQALAVVLDVQPDLEAAAQAGSLAEVREHLASDEDPMDLAVVDLGLPDADGDQLIRELVEAKPGVAVLALADRMDLEHRARAVRAGADDVIGKSSGLQKILGALRRMGRG